MRLNFLILIFFLSFQQCFASDDLIKSSNLDLFQSLAQHIHKNKSVPKELEPVFEIIKKSMCRISQKELENSKTSFLSDDFIVRKPIKKFQSSYMISEMKIFSSNDISSNENFYLCGCVKSMFENFSIISGTGILVDEYHVLTSAFTILNSSKELQSTDFYYLNMINNFICKISVCSIVFPYHALDYGEKSLNYNYALLRLSQPINYDFSSVSFLTKEQFTQQPQNLDMNQMLMYVHNSNEYKNLTKLDLREINEDTDLDLYCFKSNAPPGSCGAPLIFEENGQHKIIGLYAGKYKDGDCAVKITQEKIDEMKRVMDDQLEILSIMTQNKSERDDISHLANSFCSHPELLKDIDVNALTFEQKQLVADHVNGADRFLNVDK